MSNTLPAHLFYALRQSNVRMAKAITFVARMVLLAVMLSLAITLFLLLQQPAGWAYIFLGAMAVANLILALVLFFLLPKAHELLENNLEVPAD